MHLENYYLAIPKNTVCKTEIANVGNKWGRHFYDEQQGYLHSFIL